MLNVQGKKILVLGSGPIVIGQGAEFDYGGSQGCKVLKENKAQVILVNNNPATVMTDQEMADKIYFEATDIKTVKEIIKKERPQYILASLGGQSGLNTATELWDEGFLQEYGVTLLGSDVETIKKGEDRHLFKKLMESVEVPTIEGEIVYSEVEGLNVAEKFGYPVVVRPAYTLGGRGGGIAYSESELINILKDGLKSSIKKQVLIEKSIIGYREVEFEVVRDRDGNKLTVCSMENFDPVGVHTGDSIVVAPCQTLWDKQYQHLRAKSLEIIEEMKIVGACNIQFAVSPEDADFHFYVIEVNPRVSRSSALASKATGYPIAKIATLLALGYRLDEISNFITQKTSGFFEPVLDYLVVKVPRWPFDKFEDGCKLLGTKMKATGEVMSIDKNFAAALLKGIRGLEEGFSHILIDKYRNTPTSTLIDELKKPDNMRIFKIAECMSRGLGVEDIKEITGIHTYFLHILSSVIKMDKSIKELSFKDLDQKLVKKLKIMGFGDKYLAKIFNLDIMDWMEFRGEKLGLYPYLGLVDTCGGEFVATTPYYYGTYDKAFEPLGDFPEKKVLVLGSGPIRIGQGVEFDYCTVRGVKELKNMGYHTFILNNNPETVSTDFDVADFLLFDPITEEEVYNLVKLLGVNEVILQLGGQTAIKLGEFVNSLNLEVLGTNFESVDIVEDRDKFYRVLDKLNVNKIKGLTISNWDNEKDRLNGMEFPLIVRPSYVLGGQGMEIVYHKEQLKKYILKAEEVGTTPVLVEQYLLGKEIEVDAIADGKEIVVVGIMEHVERAGVHSGDSIGIYPTQNIIEKTKQKLYEITRDIVKELNVKGFINLQFCLMGEEIYCLEANPRASRTIPFLSKAIGFDVVGKAVGMMLNQSIATLGMVPGIVEEPQKKFIKAPIFSLEKLKDVEVALGPEMKSTGEIMVVGNTLEEGFKKLFGEGKKSVLVTISQKDKEEAIPLLKELARQNYEIFATENTAKFVESLDIKVEVVDKMRAQSIGFLEKIGVVINTPTRGKLVDTFGFKLRRLATEMDIKCFTSLDTVKVYLESNTIKDVKVYCWEGDRRWS